MAFGAAMDQQPNYSTAGGQARQRHYGGSGFTSPNADDFSTTSSNYYPPYSEMPFTSLKRRKQQQDFQLVKWAMRFVLASPVLVIVCWTIGAMLFHTSSTSVVSPVANKSTSRQLHKQQQQGPRRGAATGHSNNNNNNNPNKITTGYMLPNGGMPPMMMMPANANVPPGYMMVMVPQTQQGGEPQQQQQLYMQQQQQHHYHPNGIPVIAPMGSTNSNAASTATTTTTMDNVAPHPMIVQPHLQTMQQQQQGQQQQDYPQMGQQQQQQREYPPQMGQQQQVQAMGQQQQQQQAQPMGVAASAMIASPLSQQQQQQEAAEVVPLDPMTSTSQQQSGRSHPRPHPLPRATEPYYDTTTTTTGQAAVATPMKQQVLYYDPNHLETNSQGQYQLPSVVYDQDGNQVDLSTFQQQSTPIYMEPPTRKTLQMPQNLGEIQQWGASTAQDQGIIVATVAVMALLVGALSARRMRSRSVLSACIENESLEDDVAYDTAYTTHLGGQDRNGANHNGSSMGGAAGNTYNTFGGWKGDLEKFDV